MYIYKEKVKERRIDRFIFSRHFIPSKVIFSGYLYLIRFPVHYLFIIRLILENDSCKTNSCFSSYMVKVYISLDIFYNSVHGYRVVDYKNSYYYPSVRVAKLDTRATMLFP